jgi:4,5-DOPA dioxygenase extradiol
MDAAPRMPCLFVSHGTPLLLDDARWAGELRAWAAAIPKPTSALVISAHWVQSTGSKPMLGSIWTSPLTYDFKGLPKRYYEFSYKPPAARALNERMGKLLEVDHTPARGFDAATYVPMAAMYPAADVPVLEMSLPSLEIPALVELGRKLAPLRDEGVLVVGSGVLVHNDRALSFRAGEPPPAWAKDFDGWITQVIQKRDVAALAAFRKAPGARMALPTVEHFAPIAVALGASLAHDEPVTFPITGFAYGSLSRRSVQFG